MVSAPDSVLELIKRFEEHRVSYRSGRYNEAQLRNEFLNPFFEALGWGVTNKRGYAGAYKEVISEDAIKIGGATKAPDYCFRIGGTRKFFVEAKKPSINLRYPFSPRMQWHLARRVSPLPIGPVSVPLASLASAMGVTATAAARVWARRTGNRRQIGVLPQNL